MVKKRKIYIVGMPNYGYRGGSMDNIRTILKNVRTGFVDNECNLNLFKGKTFRQALEELVKERVVDQEDAHLAIIKGYKTMAAAALGAIHFGNYHHHRYGGETYGQIAHKLFKKGIIDPEEYHLSMHNGNKRMADTAMKAVKNGFYNANVPFTNMTYAQQLMDFGKIGVVDHEEAALACVEARKERELHE